MVTSSDKQNSIKFKYQQISLISLLRFELLSLYGRKILRPKPKLKKDSLNLLNLGCGSTIFEGWINADFFTNTVRFWERPASSRDWMLDLRYPMNCDDNVWDGVFSEHTLEHLYPHQALHLLKEIYRTMKPGAWLRVTVPDLRKYVHYYCGELVDERFNTWQTGCEAIRYLTQDNLHLSIWDCELLSSYLKEVGFINIKEVSFMEGTDTLLLKDKYKRAWETLYMEAQKPNYNFSKGQLNDEQNKFFTDSKSID
ncbi:MAG: methyltransferase domain-containing protein [Nostoc sp. TH1S01]|nr:methyltransferase domain-containing protein [Nostoc sp. TH1S01]